MKPVDRIVRPKKIEKHPRQREYKTQSKFEKMLNDELRKCGVKNEKDKVERTE